jgi:hypothetical protein
MVEEVAGTSAGVNMMDYLATGTILHLGPSDNLVVDYFRSCVRETIKGGTVTIGIDRSTVSGGQLRSQTVDCDGGQLHLSATESGQAGVVAFRGLHAVPSRTLFGQSPVFELAGGAGKLVVDRMDKQAPRLEIDVQANELVHGTFYDFATHDRRLAPGGIYRASIRGRSVTFKISPSARAGATALAGRLIQL